jgi:hypothetical protein
MLMAGRLTYRLSADVFCVNCGHNLRGLRNDGPCAECGQPVRWSLAGSSLYFADPDWLAKVRCGAAILTVTLPWLWVPLLWPVALFGFWRVCAPAPRETWSANAVTAFGFRRLVCFLPYVLIAIAAVSVMGRGGAGAAGFTYSLFLVAVAFALRPVWLDVTARWPRRWARFTLVFALAACVLLGACAIATLIGRWHPALGACTGFGVTFATIGTGSFLLLLASTWRLLDTAEFQSRSRRSQTTFWQPAIPGRAHSSSPALRVAGEEAGAAASPAE